MTSTISSYTPASTSGQITYTGLGNGTDFDSLITKLVQVEQSRITSLQTWKKSWTTKQTAFQTLNTQMLSLKTTLSGMDTMDEFMAKTTDTTDSSVLTATATAGAENGSHVIEVNRLATSKAMVTTTGYASATTAINSSGSSQTFAYTYKGTTYSNSIGANGTLTDLASLINNDANNPGVKASVTSDGTNYYLQLRGLDTGDSASLVIDDTATTLSGFSAANFSTISTNQSAQLKLDGWPTASNAYITRETNSITDLLAGITLNLKSAGTVTTTTATDTETIKEHISTFVEQMNAVRTTIKEITNVDSSTKQASILTGNYGIQLIGSNLKSAVAEIGLGFDYDADKYATLSQIGILTDAEEGSETQGLLVIDDTILDARLTSNADAVGQLFAARYTGRTSSSDFSIGSYISGTTGFGTYELSYTTDASGKITAATINGNPTAFNSNSNTITGKYGYPEAGLVIRAIDTSAGVHTGQVSLKQGKAGQLNDLLGELTDETDGPLHILDNNYDDITAMIDKKIAFEERRINNYASSLRKRFAKTDALLGTYNNMQTQLTSAIAKLNDD
ncbi:flagellar filament capping protein FliD [Desulfovibrio aerotolerans]|uniref:Flagellar hook-associated protein 2 n=1 Tax=Solidesulfovibrio aerotolerans TaxID=295255 RepID=A0A7C9N3B8_9BACT|nr:flagellar filament capping protein FliD [Solidesulfovibrio aerotolerans]MYL84411.1 flagellar filament capping protein FliD [Solidesulfovibrio aerotolerans]